MCRHEQVRLGEVHLQPHHQALLLHFRIYTLGVGIGAGGMALFSTFRFGLFDVRARAAADEQQSRNDYQPHQG